MSGMDVADSVPDVIKEDGSSQHAVPDRKVYPNTEDNEAPTPETVIALNTEDSSKTNDKAQNGATTQNTTIAPRNVAISNDTSIGNTGIVPKVAPDMEQSDDNEVITYLRHVVQETFRVMKCYSAKHVPSTVLQQCKFFLFELNIFAALERLEITSQKLNGEILEKTIRKPKILEDILQKIEDNRDSYGNVKIKDVKNLRKRRGKYKKRKRLREEEEEEEEGKNNRKEEGEDVVHEETQTRRSTRQKTTIKKEKEEEEKEEYPEAEENIDTEYVERILNEAEKETKRRNLHKNIEPMVQEATSSEDSENKGENAQKSSRKSKPAAPKPAVPNPAAPNPAAPKPRIKLPPSPVVEEGELGEAGPEEGAPERKVADDQLTLSDITIQIRAAQKPKDAIESNTCAICLLLCESRRHLMKHIKTHAGGFPFACTKCPKSFATSAKLAAHERGIHSKKALYKCEDCNRKFYRYDKYRHHLALKHSGTYECKCDICGKGYFSQSTLTRHMNKKHKTKSDNKEEWKCPVCNRQFSNERLLKAHSRTHTGERPYICMQCGMAFSCSSTLSSHKRTHSGERPYICTICKKGFTQMSALQTHKRIHSGDKPFKCQYCGMGFNQSGHLQRHEKRHTQTKDYVCHLCGKGFIETHSLKVHVRTHTGERPFKCTECTWAFSCRTHLVRHQKTHEKNGAKRKVMPRPKKEQKPPTQQLQQAHQQQQQHQQQPQQQQQRLPQQQQQQLPNVVPVEHQQPPPISVVPAERMYEVHFERNEGQGYVEKRIEPVTIQGQQQVQQGQQQVQQGQQQVQQGQTVQHTTDGHIVVSVENGEVALLRQQSQNQVQTFQASQLAPVSHVTQVSHMVPLTATSGGQKWNPQTFPLAHPVTIASQSDSSLHLTGQPVTVPQPVIGLPVAIPVSQSESSLLMCQSEEVITATKSVNY